MSHLRADILSGFYWSYTCGYNLGEFIYPTSAPYLDKYVSLWSSTAACSYSFSAPSSAMILEAWEVTILYKCLCQNGTHSRFRQHHGTVGRKTVKAKEPENHCNVVFWMWQGYCTYELSTTVVDLYYEITPAGNTPAWMDGLTDNDGYEESVFFRNESPDGMSIANGHPYTHMHTSAPTGPRISYGYHILKQKKTWTWGVSERGHGSRWRRVKADITKNHYAPAWNSFIKQKERWRKLRWHKGSQRTVARELAAG